MLKVILVMLGTMNITAYRSVPEQTDDSPFTTSIGEHVHPHGCAVSRDMLKRWGGPLNYGDMLYIEGIGFKIINDTMHQRHKRSVDIWVKTYNEEKRLAPQRRRVWLVIPHLEN